jgi:hypothetical protein
MTLTPCVCITSLCVHSLCVYSLCVRRFAALCRAVPLGHGQTFLACGAWLRLAAEHDLPAVGLSDCPH